MNKVIVAVLFSLLSLLSVVAAPVCAAVYTADWIVEIHSEKLADPFIGDSARLQKIYKTSTTYRASTASEPEPYEDMWFAQGKPMGMERSGPIGVVAGQDSVIHVYLSSASPDTDEVAAVTDSVLRVWLDCRLAGSNVTTIYVPNDGFTATCEQMERRWHFYEANNTVDRPYRSNLIILVQSEAGVQKRVLAHD